MMHSSLMDRSELIEEVNQSREEIQNLKQSNITHRITASQLHSTECALECLKIFVEAVKENNIKN